MRIAYELCLATAGKQVPGGPDWIHEVKHDGYRMLVIREPERVRLLSRNGTDWTKRYPLIAEVPAEESAEAVRHRWRSRGDGISDFNALHARKHEHEVQLYAFDILAIDGDDMRVCPCTCDQPGKAFAWRPERITVAPFERGAIGPDLFRAACRLGLEGLVSKHRDRAYRGRRQKHWIKVNNRSHPAMGREL
ncbi:MULTISPECIES: ATP-dependent DNA ligase [unclassified Bradyrhizobium]